jgi:hypothetical protein
MKFYPALFFFLFLAGSVLPAQSYDFHFPTEFDFGNGVPNSTITVVEKTRKINLPKPFATGPEQAFRPTMNIGPWWKEINGQPSWKGRCLRYAPPRAPGPQGRKAGEPLPTFHRLRVPFFSPASFISSQVSFFLS